MKLNEKVWDNALWGEKTNITPEIVEFYKKNPKELDLIIDKEYFYGKFIKFFFIIGIVLTLASRLLKFFFVGKWSDFVNDVILDVFSELGIAVFGGAITAFILENLKQRQYRENVAFRKEILRLIKESEHNDIQE